jgi:hypothetical protein
MVLATHNGSANRLSIAVTIFLGLAIFCAGSYVLITQTVFNLRASAHNGTVVEVRHELVPKGKGSVPGYVPIVEVPDANQRLTTIRVDTYSEEPVYKVGQQLQTLCDLSSSKCIPDTFLAKWGDPAVLFGLSFIFFLIAFIEWRA